MSELPTYLKKYFTHINDETERAYLIARHARSLGYDPAPVPEIQIAKNMAERVVGHVTVLAPQLGDTNVVDRIQELEKQKQIR